MSIALATKGIISGIGFGSGAGGGGLYPDGYIASTIDIAVDLSEPSITIASDSMDVSVSLQDAIGVSIDTSSLSVDITVDDPEMEVDV